jgi:hypothetical protein
METDRSSVNVDPKPRGAVRSLGAIARHLERMPVTRKRDLAPGDCVIVTTKNSVYCLQALGGDQFDVSGGWFDRTQSRGTFAVNGCTVGGSAICTDIVAAIGLFLEFNNRVATTRIQDVRVLRLGESNGRTLN